MKSRIRFLDCHVDLFFYFVLRQKKSRRKRELPSHQSTVRLHPYYPNTSKKIEPSNIAKRGIKFFKILWEHTINP